MSVGKVVTCTKAEQKKVNFSRDKIVCHAFLLPCCVHGENETVRLANKNICVYSFYSVSFSGVMSLAFFKARAEIFFNLSH